MTSYLATILDTSSLGSLSIRFDQVISVDSDGEILSIVSEREWSAGKSEREREGLVVLPKWSFLLPTYTDLHIHPAQFLYAGTGLSLPLLPWLAKYAYEAEQRIDDSSASSFPTSSRAPDPTSDSSETGILQGDRDGEGEGDGGALTRRVYKRLGERLIREGTGCVLAFGTIGVESNLILAETFLDLGIRGYIGKLSMDIQTSTSHPRYLEPSTATSLSSLNDYIERMRSLVAPLPENKRLVHPVITPRFVPTCSDELLRGLGEVSRREGVRVQSHMCESWDEMEWVRGTRGMEDEDVFEKFNLLTPLTTQAHVTSLPPTLLNRLHSQGVSIAHCPLSNIYFSDAQFPLREALDAGLKVGLGSDVAGGYATGLGVGMRMAVVVGRGRESVRVEREREGRVEAGVSTQGELVQEGEMAVGGDGGQRSLRVDWKETLYVATRGGAQALGLEGRLAPGCPFDAQLIQLIDPATSLGLGPLDFFDLPSASASEEEVREWYMEAVERWWCNGDDRNRIGMWVQGRRVLG